MEGMGSKDHCKGSYSRLSNLWSRFGSLLKCSPSIEGAQNQRIIILPSPHIRTNAGLHSLMSCRTPSTSPVLQLLENIVMVRIHDRDLAGHRDMAHHTASFVKHRLTVALPQELLGSFACLRSLRRSLALALSAY